MTIFQIQYPDGILIDASINESSVQTFGSHSHTTDNNYSWYSLPPLKDVEFNIGISACFFHRKLVHISLAAISSEFGTSWDDFTEEKEKARAKKTRAWLKKVSLDTGTYSWGTVDCGYDAKAASGSASIWLFCNQNTFLGLQLSMKEYGTIKQIFINHLSNWDKTIAKNWGFTQEQCHWVYAIFPHAEDAVLSKKVVLKLLNNLIENKTAVKAERLGFNIKQTASQLKQLHTKLSAA
jgi:hypothetical protein